MILHPIRKKRAAIELSMTTIIVVVLSLTLLILGFVFIRSIMCSAIGITDDVSKAAEKEVERLFSTSNKEIKCIGADNEVAMTPGINTIHCILKASQEREYRISVESIDWLSNDPALKSVDLDSWLVKRGGTYPISPGDDSGLKPITLDIPEDAPEGSFRIKISVTRDGVSASGIKELDFRVTRTGVVRNVLC